MSGGADQVVRDLTAIYQSLPDQNSRGLVTNLINIEIQRRQRFSPATNLAIDTFIQGVRVHLTNTAPPAQTAIPQAQPAVPQVPTADPRLRRANMSSNDSANAEQASELTKKSKGKQAEQHDGGEMSMEDDSEAEDTGAEDVPEDADEDNMEEIDTDNILGERTRGKTIDWNEAEQKAKEAGEDLEEEDDDEDDEDFEDPDDEMKD